MTSRFELIREQFVTIRDSWERQLRSDPARVARQVRAYLRWIEGIDAEPGGEADLRAAI